jgi:transcriptional regulator with XRE-family HTH domain
MPLSNRESLGACIERRRRELEHSTRSLAFAVGVPEHVLSAWKADAALPDADQVERLCQALHISPLRLLPQIRETARRILRDTLADAAGVPRAMAARQRGDVVDESDRMLVENLPSALRAQLAREWQCAVEDVAALAEGLRRQAGETAERQDVWVGGMAAELQLEGEEELPHFEP